MTRNKANITLAVVSYKGGVGKTTLVANLAGYCSDLGAEVAAIDMDDQNGLGLHFGYNPLHEAGFSKHYKQQNWIHEAVVDESGVTLFRHGNQQPAQRERFKETLRHNKHMLKDWLQDDYHKNDLVIIDTPPGGDVYARQSIIAADYLLVVLHADAASFATIGTMESLVQDIHPNLIEDKRLIFVITNYDERRALDKSVLATVRQMRGEQVAPMVIHYDASLREAAANQRLLMEYDAESQAHEDFTELAKWLLGKRLVSRGI